MRKRFDIMKKLLLLGLCVLLLQGCAAPPADENGGIENGGNELVQPEKPTEQRPPAISVETRFLPPAGFTRLTAEPGSFAAFVRGYPLKAAGAPILLYNGEEKEDQTAHAAVFALPMEEKDLQQCADSVMRMYAEYYWKQGQAEKIGFYLTNGTFCDYTKWRDGYRFAIKNNKVIWSKTAEYDASYETFVQYLLQIFCYAGTLSMETYETEVIELADMTIGDVMLRGGSPGHVVMVVDVCENADGQRAWLLAQGSMPAQEFHLMRNPLHPEDPWYYEAEIASALQTPEYEFLKASMLRRLCY